MTLPGLPSYAAERRSRLDALLSATQEGPPADLAGAVAEQLGVDLRTRYGGCDIPHPFGKASGQLSCTVPQVDDDLRAGLAFIVLKTVIAEDASGMRSMEAWTIRETRMQVERRTSATGREGWTVTWMGRGWPGTLEEYVTFFADALRAARSRDVPIVPSVKYHLPLRGEAFRDEEYRHTTGCLLEAWEREGCGGPMLLEKDFSPTLAGDAISGERDTVLRWLREVPRLVVAGGEEVRLGVKVMNATSDDAFQIDMLETLCREADPRPAYLVVFNRLFDSDRRVAYGGWDLSDRNLRVLDRARAGGLRLLPLSGTGNICSGRMMLEYALRGCENGQVHTFFQVPRSEYTATAGPRSACALHTLLLHPTEGLVPWLWHMEESGRVDAVNGMIRFRDVVGLGNG